MKNILFVALTFLICAQNIHAMLYRVAKAPLRNYIQHARTLTVGNENQSKVNKPNLNEIDKLNPNEMQLCPQTVSSDPSFTLGQTNKKGNAYDYLGMLFLTTSILFYLDYLRSEHYGDGEPSLCRAARENDIQTVKILINLRSNVNQADKNGNAPLHFASSWRNANTTKLLIKAGADVNQVGEYGDAPLRVASMWGCLDNAKLLINAGANVNQVGNHEGTPLHNVSFGVRYFNEPPYDYTDSRDYTNIAKLLINSGADVNQADEYGNTPLHTASHNGYGVMQSLINAGADVNRANKRKQNPLDTVPRGEYDVMKLLIESGAKTYNESNMGFRYASNQTVVNK